MARQKNQFQKGEREFHLRAYVDMMGWASRQSQMLEAFTRDTGCKISFARTPLDAMIDKATGRDRQIFEAFAKWCAEKYGVRYLPENYLEVISKKETNHV